MKSLALLLCSVGSLYFSDVCGKCPPDDLSKLIVFEAIPEDQYDRNFSSITDVDARPLGFDQATWSFEQNNDNPCVKITGAAQRRIEIMFETHPSARLCVKDQTSQNSETQCSDAATGSFYDCRRSSSDAMYLEFFCDQGEEYDVRFWYRLVLGLSPAEDPEDMWCDDRVQGEYPASLQQLPSNFPFQPITTGSPDSALTTLSSSVLVSVTAGLISFRHFLV